MILAFLGKLFNLFDRFKNKCVSDYTKNRFCSCGRHVYLGKGSVFTPTSISVGDNVYIGARCVIQSAHGQIFIGNHVMLGPGVHVHGGNHPINVIGGGLYGSDSEKTKFGWSCED